jgi:DNA modification methylase
MGDAREILPTCARADVLITDPPYGIGLTEKTSYRDHSENRASSTYGDDPEYVRGLIRTFIPAVLAKTERALIFCGPAMLREYPEPASIGSVLALSYSGRTAWGFQCTHPVLFYGKDPFLADGKGGRPNSLRGDWPKTEEVDHPCPKPVAWMQWAVGRASRIGETVIDPFAGSGTTGVACVNMGRKFIGIEGVESYFDIACRRISEALKQPDMFIEKPAGAKPESLFAATGRP